MVLNDQVSYLLTYTRSDPIRIIKSSKQFPIHLCLLLLVYISRGLSPPRINFLKSPIRKKKESMPRILLLDQSMPGLFPSVNALDRSLCRQPIPPLFFHIAYSPVSFWINHHINSNCQEVAIPHSRQTSLPYTLELYLNLFLHRYGGAIPPYTLDLYPRTRRTLPLPRTHLQLATEHGNVPTLTGCYDDALLIMQLDHSKSLQGGDRSSGKGQGLEPRDRWC